MLDISIDVDQEIVKSLLLEKIEKLIIDNLKGKITEEEFKKIALEIANRPF